MGSQVLKEARWFLKNHGCLFWSACWFPDGLCKGLTFILPNSELFQGKEAINYLRYLLNHNGKFISQCQRGQGIAVGPYKDTSKSFGGKTDEMLWRIWPLKSSHILLGNQKTMCMPKVEYILRPAKALNSHFLLIFSLDTSRK